MSDNANIAFKDNMKILVVEDDIDVGFIMKRRLATLFEGAHIEIAKTALAGQKYLYHNSVDFIFLDLNLPDGMGASSVVDLKPYAKETPIVVTTGLANELTIKEVLKAGATALMLKTDITKDSLLEVIQKYVQE